MISIAYLFEEDEFKISNLINQENVIKLINLSKEYFSNGSLSAKSSDELKDILKDPSVKNYLHECLKISSKMGLVENFTIGNLLVSLTKFSVGIIFALAVVGAISSGLALGYLWSKVNGLLNNLKSYKKESEK